MKLEGEIGEIHVIEHLVEMGRERFTGAVRFENDGIIKIIYFKTGDVLSASTNDRADSIDEILLRAGKVTREHVKQALGKRKETETLGDALLNLGFITRKELTWARRAQVIGVIRSIDNWPAGQFTVVADYLPKREEGMLFPLPQIIIELVVTDQERQKYERSLDGGNAVFRKAPTFAESFRALGLNEDAEAIAAQIDGTRNAAEVASTSGKDSFNVYKLLHALALLGLLERAGEPQVAPEISFETQDDIALGAEGVADASDMWDEAVPPAEEPPLSLGLDFPVAPAMSEAQFEAAPAPPRIDQMPDWGAEPAAQQTAPAGAAPPTPAAEVPKAKWDVQAVPAAAATSEQWGFDEAQLDTARRAAAPQRASDRLPPSMRQVAKKPSKPNQWIWILIGAAVLIAIAFGGVAVWNWWQSRSAVSSQAQVTPAAQRPRRRVPAPISPVTKTAGTVAPVTASVPQATSSQLAALTAPPAAAATTARVPPVTTAATAKAAAPAAPVSSGTYVQQGTAGATITNAGAPPSDALRAHYDEMARKFAAQPGGNYTVQFELVCESASLTTAVKHGGSNVWFVPFSYRGRPCYRVFWGHYATQAEATAAKSAIPAALKGSAAAVVVSVPKGSE